MWVEFKHPAVRDLAWCIGSPALLNSRPGRFPYPVVSDQFCRLAFWDRIPWLRSLDADPTPLIRWLEHHEAQRLGVYFEVLIEFWLQHWQRFDLRLSHRTIRRAGRDLSELDFVFVDGHLAHNIHWETALKYYLCVRQVDGVEAWLGPNPHDRWQHKRDAVFHRQLALSQTPEAQNCLGAMGLLPLNAMAYIKGYLFYPLTPRHDTAHCQSRDFSVNHLRGWWCPISECAALQGRASRWLILPRLAWMASPRRCESHEGMEFGALLESLETHFARHQQAQLVVELKAVIDGWREVSRGFVVSEQWPLSATR